MLNEEKIKEAKSNVRSYLEDNLLKKETFNSIVFEVLKKNAEESLETSEYLSSRSNLWTIITAYYSMFYIANATLYKLGYKVGDKIAHKVTSDALVVFVRNKLKKSFLEEYEEIRYQALAGTKTDELVHFFDLERQKRGKIQYQTTENIKKQKAELSLQRAKEFNLAMRKLLRDIK
jgi:uncharacterized protein (UPF0332 family)